MRCLVLACTCYAISGTDIPYASTLRHAKSGSDIGYAATRSLSGAIPATIVSGMRFLVFDFRVQRSLSACAVSGTHCLRVVSAFTIGGRRDPTGFPAEGLGTPRWQNQTEENALLVH
eukprot:1318906-Rhodomonas_salina.3